ncbi:MAG: hypothetical protein FD173_322 [Gallionellaceae bacterium]|nr:MAG: hypothetical protein FD173_322 [Gallionellaceae bacterium]
MDKPNSAMKQIKFSLYVCAMSLISFLAHPAEHCGASWPLWEKFAQNHIALDGRVIDYDADDVSTSEGQSYALFFSLVAGDKARFDLILKWINDNLAEGDLRGHLPAWKWGLHADGTWRVLDANRASDADLWIAYSLYQAASIWKESSYHDTASAMLQNISQQEVVALPQLGRMLLPAPYGFVLGSKVWRLNPSYLPVQLLRYFSTVDKLEAWDEIALNTLRMIASASNRGVVPDWVLFDDAKGFQFDLERGRYSGYDSIRVYLWWAMLSQNDPLFEQLRPYVTGAAQFVPGRSSLPELIDVSDGKESGQAPIGFAAALAPYRLVVYGHRQKAPASLAEGAGYYNYVLSLFGYGWMEKRFLFNRDGSLQVNPRKCSK